MTALLEEEGSLELPKLKVKTLRYMAKNKIGTAPQRNPIAQMVATEEWLLENGFMVEDETVMMAE